MAKEIERKFLVRDNSFESMAVAKLKIRQNYISRVAESTVRIRIEDNVGKITVKTKNEGAERNEWEYEVPVSDAVEMLEKACGGREIVKTRFVVPYKGHIWEVDRFESPKDLIVAEVELEFADEPVELPEFIGEEVTGNPSYYNSNI